MIASFIISGLILGMLGSFHCVGMCGPLALSLPVQHLQGVKRFFGILLYNFGRVFTYSLIGFVAGFAGLGFSLFGWQQILSITLGSILLLVFFGMLFRKRIFKNKMINDTWNRFIINRLTPLYRSKNFYTLFLIGLLNGLLPCGLVYIALSGALATGNILYSSLFMASFGLGTLPAMMIVSFAGNIISIQLRIKIKKAVPYVIGFMGVLLILRGLNLNIPFISPALAINHAVECH